MSNTTRKPRRMFTEKQKSEAVNYYFNNSDTIKSVAERFQVGQPSLSKWIRKATQEKRETCNNLSSKHFPTENNPPLKPASTIVEDLKELQKLRKEVKTLRKERNFLKRTTAFFAKELFSDISIDSNDDE